MRIYSIPLCIDVPLQSSLPSLLLLALLLQLNQTLSSINNTLPQPPKLDPQHPARLLITKLKRLWRLPILLRLRHLAPQLRKLLPQNLTNLLVEEPAPGTRKPLPTGLGQLVRPQVRDPYIPHVAEDGECSLADLGGLAGHEAVDVRARGVQLAEVRNRVVDGSVDHRRANRRDIETRFALLDKVESVALGKGFARAVSDGPRSALGLLVGRRVPVRLGVCVSRAGAFGDVDYGGEGGGDDDALDCGGVRGDGLDEGFGAVDGRDQEVALVVLDGHLEGRGRVDYPVDALDCFVEGAGSGDVRDDGEAELGGVLCVRLADVVGGGLGADRAADFVAGGEEGADDVGGDEA